MWGRPSPAADARWALRPLASAPSAAIRADGGDADGWVVRAASLSGTRHRLAGTGPEDAYAWACAGGALVVAVADGVSNRPGSAATATAATEAAVAVLAEEGPATSPRAALDGPPTSPGAALDGAAMSPGAALAAANEAAARSGTGSGTGATTVVVAVLRPSGRVHLGRVGDSTAFVLSADGWREVWPPEPDDGTVHTATRALPSERPGVEEGSVVLGVGEVLVLVTDGVADPLRDGPTTVAPGLAAALAWPPDPLDLARLLDFSRQGVHDDRTLVAVWSRARVGGAEGR